MAKTTKRQKNKAFVGVNTNNKAEGRKKVNFNNEINEIEDLERNNSTNEQTAVYVPRNEKPDEAFEYENSAYSMLHNLTPPESCLSFSFIPDGLGAVRTKFPHSVSLCCGSQNSSVQDNKVFLLQGTKLHKTKYDKEFSDTESEMSMSDIEDEDAVVNLEPMKHTGSINRLKNFTQNSSSFITTFSETSNLYLFEVTNKLNELDAESFPVKNKLKRSNTYSTPVSCYKAQAEGWGFDVSTIESNIGLGTSTGDIRVLKVADDSLKESKQYSFDQTSVEDLSWSPSEKTVFSSASTDGLVRIFDTRSPKPGSMLDFIVSKTDVNCVEWNHRVHYLLATGDDNGELKIWDLRKLGVGKKASAEIGFFDWHKKAITGISWDPFEESVLALSSEDETVTLWDLALEKDDAEEEVELPPQLLFIHGGVVDAKGVEFHPQVKGLIGANAVDGIHLFIPEPLETTTSKKTT
eukprot:maker-scaffold_15-snap-gene-7.39-mRNA-1 protein AED:0.24 eAED:0.24 QI:97/1/1/1/1/1/2/131/463